ncbi:Gfo/Idh/MocA family oxidoreductase [Niastella populi]|uniref:Dehydrogenase n=1 Tax=Niastella populi TaxID=550983 RepID=A0A1V9GCI7_9BACT|nr:Gfo/Idh/MocA family oxidoreductase [Niastella populi]OQP68323.1 dehydrogenase [Niastella populi]
MNRKVFLRTALALFAGSKVFAERTALPAVEKGKRVGIIGLDTSHSIAFTRLLNNAAAGDTYDGYKVVAAYPFGSRELALSQKRIPLYTEEIKTLGVQVTTGIQELLRLVDVVLLETNDGRLHKEQALEVFRAGKPVFIDKPIAASLKDTLAIFAAAEKYNIPLFSSSALRYLQPVQEIQTGRYGKITGADVFSPAFLEPTHPDLFWYGIHGVEMLYALMGMGCISVQRHFTTDSDFVTATWKDGRIGTFRGLRAGKTDFGGTCYCEKNIVSLGTFTGYEALLQQVTAFFNSGKSPVAKEETLELIAFLEAAEKSKQTGGKPVRLGTMMTRAKTAYKK